MNTLRKLLLLPLVVAFVGCANAPEEIMPVATEAAPQNTLFNQNQSQPQKVEVESGLHTIRVLEVLQAERYTYLRVTHGEKEIWVATIKGPYQPGELYQMKTGLLKTNFKSVEHNRTFAEIYLVSEIYPVTKSVEKQSGTDEIDELQPVADVPEGVIAISELIKNAERFAGKTVRVFGKVVKVNPNIMERNWIHLDDGSASDYDFVLTTQSQVPVGHEVAFEGTVAVNRDFGAGYTYEIIIENAKLVK